MNMLHNTHIGISNTKAFVHEHTCCVASPEWTLFPLHLCAPARAEKGHRVGRPRWASCSRPGQVQVGRRNKAEDTDMISKMSLL